MRVLFAGILLVIVGMFNCAAQSLTPSLDTIKKNLYYLASDEFEGRNTGERGQIEAARFIAHSFKNFGLKPLYSSTYFNYYNLKKYHRNFMVVKNNGNILFWPWHFLYVSAYNHTDTIHTHIVFAGYGSENELKTLDISSKAIALISDSPAEAYKTIKSIAQKHSNKYYFVILPKNDKFLEKAWADKYELSSYGLPVYFDRVQSQSINEEWAHPKDSLNIYYCFTNVMRNVFMKNDEELKKVADDNIAQGYSLLSSLVSPEIKCMVNYHDSIDNIRVKNVGGIIYGKDTTRTLVVSAHHDHIGIELGEVNNGADDNGSGTVALLECARLMGVDAKNGILPETNVLFVSFSGEELGLLGSEAFVSDTSVDISKCYHNINMDMIGRWDEKHENKRSFVYLLTAGKDSKKRYKMGKKKLVLPKNFVVSNKPGPKEKHIFKYGSDHYSFLKKGIPVSVFFTGLHNDYHTPADTPDKINYENLTNITGMVYQYIYKVAEN